MAVGYIDTEHLTDIANAIRQQNGTSTLYTPAEMAQAVLDLDGTSAGSPGVEPYLPIQTGIVSERYLEDIADAIRVQNGSANTYLPSEMAQAILDLNWATLGPRALRLSDGTLEFTYLASRQSPSGGTVVAVYDIDPAGYTRASDRPWYGIRNQIIKARFDSSFADAGITNADYWFNAMSYLKEVEGFENFQGLVSATQMFAVCGELESIFATEYDASTITTSTLMFSNSYRLVGSDGAVPGTATSSAANCHLGAGGLLSDPDDDPRLWYWGHVYADGALEITANSIPDSSRTLVSSGRLCTIGKYNGLSAIPWYDDRTVITSITFLADMATFSALRLNYTFYGCRNATSVSGLSYLSGVSSMRYTFDICSSLTEVDLRGFDPSVLTDVTCTFASCTSLVTIYADSTWMLPSGASGLSCFSSDTSLVGGAGTTYSSSKTSYKYLRIDGGTATPGYLTAA